MPLCPPQIPHDLTWARTRAAAVGSQRLRYGTAISFFAFSDYEFSFLCNKKSLKVVSGKPSYALHLYTPSNDMPLDL
jgi:hypothetical protein